MKLSLALLFVLLLPAISFSQEGNDENKCKVLLLSIAGFYEGDCKKGMAHGEGTARGDDVYQGEFRKGLPDGYGIYTWANGNSYKGNWKKGKQYGSGIMTVKLPEKDSIIEGYWKDNKYLGETFRKYDYKIIEKRDIENVTINKYDETGDEVRIRLFKMGFENQDVQYLFMTSSSGNESAAFKGFDNVTFPVKISVSYQTVSRTGTSIRNCKLAFEIFEPGIWEVHIDN